MLGRGKPIFAFGAIEREILQGKIIRRAKVSRSTSIYSRHVLTARQRNVDDMVGAIAWQMPWMTDRQAHRHTICNTMVQLVKQININMRNLCGDRRLNYQRQHSPMWNRVELNKGTSFRNQGTQQGGIEQHSIVQYNIIHGITLQFHHRSKANRWTTTSF